MRASMAGGGYHTREIGPERILGRDNKQTMQKSLVGADEGHEAARTSCQQTLTRLLHR